MWEAIRDNARRSRLLIGVMAAMLVGMGYVFGRAYGGPEGGIAGVVGAVALWLVMLIAALSGGERLVLMAARARKVTKQDAPQLWNVVEEMSIASGLGSMPQVYVIDNDMPNAFATGRKPESSAVAVTSGLMQRLNRDELQGVIAHEIAHIKNFDVRFMTIAAVMLGSIVILADVFIRVLWFGGGSRRRDSGGGQGQAIFMIIAVVAAIIAPIFAQMLYFACSRKREYLADASAARFTRYPEGLASALEKISGAISPARAKREVPRALAPMYIINPLQAASRSAGLFSTHPPAAKRVEILRSMGGNAGWADYERACRKVTGDGSGIDARTLQSEESIPARQPSAVADPRKDAATRGREVADLIDRMVSFLIIACPCGVQIKVPPDLKRDQVRCTRCGRQHEVPHAETDGESPPSGKQEPEPAPLRYVREGTGWESFKCSCGNVMQISPAFDGNELTCGKCRQRIRIE